MTPTAQASPTCVAYIVHYSGGGSAISLRSDYEDHTDSYRQIGQFLEDVYNHEHIHSVSGYPTPVELETQWRARQPTLEGVH